MARIHTPPSDTESAAGRNLGAGSCSSGRVLKLRDTPDALRCQRQSAVVTRLSWVFRNWLSVRRLCARFVGGTAASDEGLQARTSRADQPRYGYVAFRVHGFLASVPVCDLATSQRLVPSRRSGDRVGTLPWRANVVVNPSAPQGGRGSPIVWMRATKGPPLAAKSSVRVSFQPHHPRD